MQNTDVKPLVSIIVPVYNVEQYLPQCLDSIVNQTYENIEVICVNDGSPDNSIKILEDYALRDSRIKVVSQKIRVFQVQEILHISTLMANILFMLTAMTGLM